MVIDNITLSFVFTSIESQSLICHPIKLFNCLSYIQIFEPMYFVHAKILTQEYEEWLLELFLLTFPLVNRALKFWTVLLCYWNGWLLLKNYHLRFLDHIIMIEKPQGCAWVWLSNFETCIFTNCFDDLLRYCYAHCLVVNFIDKDFVYFLNYVGVRLEFTI